MPDSTRQNAPWRSWHLFAPREPVPDTCDHGRPDHQLMLRQLSEALGFDLPALPLTPAVVWEGLLSEVERLRDVCRRAADSAADYGHTGGVYAELREVGDRVDSIAQHAAQMEALAPVVPLPPRRGDAFAAYLLGLPGAFSGEGRPAAWTARSKVDRPTPAVLIPAAGDFEQTGPMAFRASAGSKRDALNPRRLRAVPSDLTTGGTTRLLAVRDTAPLKSERGGI